MEAVFREQREETGRNRVVRFDSDEFNEHIASKDGSYESRSDVGDNGRGGEQH